MAEGFVFAPGNIWSGAPAKSGLAVLTNPTHLAKQKGNLKGDYPIRYAAILFSPPDYDLEAVRMPECWL